MTADRCGLSDQQLLAMYQRMVEIRAFEEKIRFLFLEGLMPGTIHQYQGQEACAVGVCSALADGDVATSTHRPHGHCLARGLSMNEVMAELFAKTTGCCHGKGGSMHMGDLDKGILPAIAIVGGAIPIATGIGLAFKLRKEPRVAACFFGDGAANEGAFHEGVNMAAIYNLPVVFVCENNLYGASTRVDKVMKVANVADRACAYGIPGAVADGNNVLAVYAAAKEAVDRARSGGGPTLLELKTYRRVGHSRRDPAKYRAKEEEETWFERDPLVIAQHKLEVLGVMEEAKVAEISSRVERMVDESVAFAQASPDPRPEDALKDVYA